MKISKNIIAAANEAPGQRKMYKNERLNTKPQFTRDLLHTVTQDTERGFYGKYSIDMEDQLYGVQRQIYSMLRNHKKSINEYV